MQLNENNRESAQPGDIFYRCYWNLENLKVIETWVYRGYLRFGNSTPDCDVPYFYYLFELHGGNPVTPYLIRLPSKDQFQKSMLTWTGLKERLAEFED